MYVLIYFDLLSTQDDRYFISGALDGKIRLWSIPDKRVVLWNEVEGQPNLITAANFCQVLSLSPFQHYVIVKIINYSSLNTN